MQETAISWATHSWNCVAGCSHASDGCRFCYAEELSLRFGWSKKPWTDRNAVDNVILKPHKLREPYKLKGNQRIFVNSMADAFHELVPDEFVAAMFKTMNENPQHIFQLLTKRAKRLAEWPGPWTPNIWAGASVEDERVLWRVDAVKASGAHVKWLSCEPLLAPLPNLDVHGLDWIVVGGESGRHFKDGANRDRWMDHAWAREIRDKCVEASVPFFFKQSSALWTERGTELVEEDGSKNTWHQFPESAVPTSPGGELELAV